jgi:ATP-dependent helicase/nuclease subunit B
MLLPDPIRNALERGATILAASPRAARGLRLAYASLQHENRREVWPTPPIFDWDSWLRELWSEQSFLDPDAPLLLTYMQESALWERVQGDDAALVVSPKKLADLAREAYSLLCGYEAHRSRNAAWDQADAERFRHWAAAFDEECHRKRWISASRLETQLAATDESLQLPRELVLIGFDRILPAQQSLLSACKERGAYVWEFKPEPAGAQPLWIAAVDRRDEITACAQWTREGLLKNTQSRIGIIVQDADSVRGEMERTFRRVLMPESEDIFADSAAMPFEFSLGQPLAQIPAIRAALLLLRWIDGALPEEEISWLMLSGFTADDAEFLPLARVDAERRNSGSPSPELSLEGYLHFIDLAKYPLLQDVHTRLGDLLQAATANNVRGRERTHSASTDLVRSLLKTAGWPGPRPADSYQFQAQIRWERLLDDVALLDFDGTRLRFSALTELLEQQAGNTIFAPESRDAPVQIMGSLESSGQQFDALWFSGADDRHWPLHARLHPLLPPAVQRQYGMPHAMPESDWELAQSVTERLRNSAQQIVFSYAQHDKDGELRPSPLIEKLFPSGTQPEATTALWPREKEASLLSLEEVSDTSGMLPWPRVRTAGGSEVLRSQAACPFQAFATKRLHAEVLNNSEWGLSAAERGNLLHKILERIWSGPEFQSLRTHNDLIAAVAENRLGEILDRHIGSVFAELLHEHPGDNWMQSYLALEQQRLHSRLEEWLQVEAHRLPFTVEAREQQLRNAHVGDLRLNLRADRIDLLPDGTRLLIDYKTGEVSPAAWKGERPEEPQLPLYAVYGHVENVSGLLFAQIRAGKTRFQGRVRSALTQLDADRPNTSSLIREPYSEAMCDAWENTLRNLAEDFLRGEAAVDPRENKVCKYCPLPGLCRIAEQQRVSI